MYQRRELYLPPLQGEDFPALLFLGICKPPKLIARVADSAAYSVVVPVTRSLKHSVSCDCLTVSGRSYTCKHRRDLSAFPLASEYTVSIAVLAAENHIA